jgi:repressor LexA
MEKVTRKQGELLRFIEDFSERNGYSPSYREIREGLGLSSVAAVAEHIDNCVAKGRLR